ncbi:MULTISPECIES: hypothetical protein [Natrialbaceae]|uniref:hypothetical protein n=1 Tax=Natrialbaceae TaxID=1644061 RepID=UPI00207C380A|nr:hypothetical protein [Natronococcus sp. CG52]
MSSLSANTESVSVVTALAYALRGGYLLLFGVFVVGWGFLTVGTGLLAVDLSAAQPSVGTFLLGVICTLGGGIASFGAVVATGYKLLLETGPRASARRQ